VTAAAGDVVESGGAGAGELVAMVLCAGLGTRLRPLTEWLPKPALPVCGLPLIRYQLALLAGAGVRRAVVNTHHLAEAMAGAARAAAAALRLPLSVSHEPEIAGTGGALREARAALEGAGDIVLWNGDMLFDLDLGAVLAAHRREGALATMVLMPLPPGVSYAAVEVDGGGAVRRIAGSFGPGGKDLVPWHFTGVHVLSPAILGAVPARPFECDINRHVYPPLMERGAVRAHLAQGWWSDLGTPARYLQANLDVLGRAAPLARFHGADPFAGLEPSAEPGVWIAPGARLAPGAALEAPALVGPGSVVEAGATLGPLAVVGPGCRIAAGATVRESVLLDGTALQPGEALRGVVAAGSARIAARG
jgi:mannose-1-phosphate guanylyltransferase